MVKKWQNDPDFCALLIALEYAKEGKKGRVEPILSEGLVIYMWEAFRGAQEREKTNDK